MAIYCIIKIIYRNPAGSSYAPPLGNTHPKGGYNDM